MDQAGGFDKLLLDSLYEDEHARRHLQLQNAGYGPYGEMMVHNPFEQHDPFAMSSSVAPPPNVQMAMMAQQQQMLFHHQHQQQQPLQTNAFSQQQQQQQHQNDSMMMVPYQQQLPQYPQQQQQQQQQMQQLGPSNPFGDPFLSFPQNSLPPGGNHHLI